MSWVWIRLPKSDPNPIRAEHYRRLVGAVFGTALYHAADTQIEIGTELFHDVATVFKRGLAG